MIILHPEGSKIHAAQLARLRSGVGRDVTLFFGANTLHAAESGKKVAMIWSCPERAFSFLDAIGFTVSFCKCLPGGRGVFEAWEAQEAIHQVTFLSSLLGTTLMQVRP